MGLRAWSAFPGHVGNAIAFMLFGGVLNMLAFFNRTVLNYRFGIVGMGARLRSGRAVLEAGCRLADRHGGRRLLCHRAGLCWQGTAR